MCFSNFHNRFGSMQISLNFGVYYQDSGNSKKDDNDEQLNSTLNTIDVRYIMIPQLQYLTNKINQLCRMLRLWANIETCWMSVQVSSNRLQSSVFHMWRYYSIERMRRTTDYYLLQYNSSYISTWSAALSLVIILAGYLQLFFLKRLFNTKQTTETEKPSCWAILQKWWSSHGYEKRDTIRLMKFSGFPAITLSVLYFHCQ